MSTEDDLRAALAHEAGRVDPPDAWDDIQSGVEAGTRRRRFLTAGVGGLAAAAVVALVVLAVPMLGGDDATVVDSGVTGPGRETPGPTTADEVAEGDEGGERPAGGDRTDDLAFEGLWPFSSAEGVDTYPTSVGGFHGDPEVDYTDAEATALDFASTYLGFPDPAADGFKRGDARSGEIVVRPREGSPLTTVVGVRLLGGSDAWSVVFAQSPNIVVAEDQQQAEVRSPLQVAGSSTAFEGTIQVEVRQSGMGAGESLGDGFATGGSMGDMGPFATELVFDEPTEPVGALVLTTISMEDGSAQEATALPLRFASPTDPSGPGASCAVGAQPQPADGHMVVTVFHSCADDGAPAPVTRVVPETAGVLHASLEALLAGPTAAERDAGLSSFFSDRSAGTLRGVSLDDRRAIVDLDADLRSVIDGAGTSAGSAALLAELNATVLQFGTVDEVEYRLDGSCEAFGEWLQSGRCEVFTR